MMVLSSIFKSFRGAGGGAPAPPVPRRPEKPVLPDDSLPRGNVEKIQTYGLDFLDWPGYGTDTGARVQKIYRRQASEPLPSTGKPVRQLPRLPRAAAPKGGAIHAVEQDLGKNLQELLSGDKLPLGIIAAEIFSAPRSRRPFGRKIR